jgi:energy-coupling factor transport system permease protein
VRRGTKLATAMEARGFGASPTRTWARPSTLSWRDAVFLVGCVGVMAAAIGAAVAAGTFHFVGS